MYPTLQVAHVVSDCAASAPLQLRSDIGLYAHTALQAPGHCVHAYWFATGQ